MGFSGNLNTVTAQRSGSPIRNGHLLTRMRSPANGGSGATFTGRSQFGQAARLAGRTGRGTRAAGFTYR